MNLLFALTYYRPHISGLTIYVQRTVEALARMGHTVTVLTSRYDSTFSTDEIINNVRVVRIPITLRINKGVIMPGYTAIAKRLIQLSDLCFLNLPCTPVEAISLPNICHKAGKPIVGIYHCDLKLPPGLANRIANAVATGSVKYAAKNADCIVIGTEDYADASSVLRQYKAKCLLIPPPIHLPEPKAENVNIFRRRHAPNGETLIGFAARFATEKGLEYLAQAMPIIQKRIPNIKVLFAGPCEGVAGEDSYRNRVMPLISELNDRWEFLGILGDVMETFYAACDITVLPSVNCTESFGLVQVESMLSGTPVVASNIPGVRMPIKETGMGMLAAPGNSMELADAIVSVLQNRDNYIRPLKDIQGLYSLEKTIALYDNLIQRVAGNTRNN